MDLIQLGEDLSFVVAFEMEGLDELELGSARKGDLYRSLIWKLQALAILALLSKGDSNKFNHNHIRAALLRRDFLEGLRKASIDDAYHQCAGRIDGLLSGIASRSWGLVNEIIRATPSEFRSRMEYEDDYLYATAIMRLIDTDANSVKMAEIRERTQEIDLGDLAPRFDAAFAIANRDTDGFDEALRELILIRSNSIEADKERGQLEEADVIAHRLVFTEGLALLALAEGKGMSLSDEYRYCPSLGRARMTQSFVSTD